MRMSRSANNIVIAGELNPNVASARAIQLAARLREIGCIKRVCRRLPIRRRSPIATCVIEKARQLDGALRAEAEVPLLAPLEATRIAEKTPQLTWYVDIER